MHIPGIRVMVARVPNNETPLPCKKPYPTGQQGKKTRTQPTSGSRYNLHSPLNLFSLRSRLTQATSPPSSRGIAPERKTRAKDSSCGGLSYLRNARVTVCCGMLHTGHHGSTLNSAVSCQTATSALKWHPALSRDGEHNTVL